MSRLGTAAALLAAGLLLAVYATSGLTISPFGFGSSSGPLGGMVATQPEAGPVSNVDQVFRAKSIRLDNLVAEVDLVVAPAEAVRVTAKGEPDALKRLQIRLVGDELQVVQTRAKGQEWQVLGWTVFGIQTNEEEVSDLKLTITAPAGTPYEIDDMVGKINAGDLDAPVSIGTTSASGKIGRVKSADIQISGSGDLELAAVADGLKLAIAGAGSLKAAEVNGAVEVAISGSGSVEVAAGTASSFNVDIAGSGDVAFKGHVVNPSVSIAGSGEVVLNTYSGGLEQSIMGSGNVLILGGQRTF
ncbi:MAG: GIN domain-containing protein [Alphaproteobacteria bacterium]